MREDTFTNTPQDAAAYEQLRGLAEWIDDRPTRAELEADDVDDWMWTREQLRPDPWADDPPPVPRVYPPTPDDPPF